MAYYTAAHGVPFLLTLLPDPPFSPLQGATSHLLRELRAASSPVGPAPQRMACLSSSPFSMTRPFPHCRVQPATCSVSCELPPPPWAPHRSAWLSTALTHSQAGWQAMGSSATLLSCRGIRR